MKGKHNTLFTWFRVVRTTGGDDGVRAGLLASSGMISGSRVGQREDQRQSAMPLTMSGFEHAGGGQAEEHVGTDHRVGQGAEFGVLGVTGLGRLHVLASRPVDHALRVAHEDVLALDAEAAPQLEAGDRRGAGAGTPTFTSSIFLPTTFRGR